MRNMEKPTRKNPTQRTGIILAVLLVLSVYIAMNLSTVVSSSDSGFETTRPIYSEEVENGGSYANHSYGYDYDLNDTSTHVNITVLPGDGLESLAYTFDLDATVTEATLYYTWSTIIGRGSCYDGAAEIHFWDWMSSSWYRVGMWDEQSLSTRILNITKGYINSTGTFKVKFLSKSACYMGNQSTEIELYDLYVVTGSLQQDEKLTEINWHSYESGMSLAQSQNKDVMLYFHAEWCQQCKIMEENTFTDPEVIKKSADFINIKIDGDEHRDMVQKYDIPGYPTVVFLDPSGQEAGRVEGNVESSAFLKAMNSPASGSTSGKLCPDSENLVSWFLLVMVIGLLFIIVLRERKTSS